MPTRFTLPRARRGAIRGCSALLAAALPVAAAIVAPAPAFAAQPVRALLYKPLSAAPDGANAFRLSIYGDKSGAKVQVRLLAEGEDGITSGCYATAPITVDFEGWKTIAVPFSDFVFAADTNPEATSDGVGNKAMLSHSVGVVLSVTGRDTRLFFGDMGFAADASESGALLSAVDLTDTNSANKWRAVGDFDQIRSLSFGVNKQEKFLKDGKETLQVVVRSYPLSEKQLNGPAVNAQLKKAGSLPYAVYTRPPFEPIAAETVPNIPEVKAGAALTVSACPDEIEPVSFAVYTTKALSAATVRLSGALTGGGGRTLPASAIDVRVVKPSNILNGPYLLLKDDRNPLSGVPDVRTTGDPVTNIPVGTSKQFWVTLRVPRNQAPGTYRGKLVFDSAGTKPTGIPLTVEVLNLPIRTAFLQYGIELKALLTPGESVPGATAVTADSLAAQLADVKEHGFGIVMFDESGSDLETEVRAYKTAGLSPIGPIVVSQPADAASIGQVEAVRKSMSDPRYDISLYYQLPPSMMSSGAGGFADMVKEANRSSLIIAPVESTQVYASLSGAMSDTTGEKLAPIYAVSSDYAQKLLMTGKRTTGNRDYWNWSIPAQSQTRNRLLAGYLIYKTGPGFYGAFPGPYQSVPDGMDPYAAFAEDADGKDNLPLMATFPTKTGVLDTLQWEAVREGVDDIRYIGILKGYIRELKDAKRRKDATDYAESYLRGQADKASLALTPEQLQSNRHNVIREASKLRDILNPPPTPAPAPKPVVPPKAAPKPPAKKKKG